MNVCLVQWKPPNRHIQTVCPQQKKGCNCKRCTKNKRRIDERNFDTNKWIEEEIDFDDTNENKKGVRSATSQNLTNRSNKKDKKLLETKKSTFAINEADKRDTSENKKGCKSNPRHKLEDQKENQGDDKGPEIETEADIVPEN